MDRPRIGDSIPRTEDRRFLTGRGRYIDDITLDGQAVAAVLRSPYAHAVINGIDATDALALAGVLAVVTADDWKKEGFGPIPTKSAVRNNRDGSELAEPPRHCLAMDRARYVGEPVALVVAETQAIALDALELVDVDYAPLDAVVDPVKALEDGAPRLWDDIENNLCYGTSILAALLRRYDGDEERALLAYNGCVRGTNTPNCHNYPARVARLREQVRREWAAIAPAAIETSRVGAAAAP